MSKRPTVDFVDVLEREGVATDSATLEANLRDDVKAAGSKISNDSAMSPFWRWVRAAVTSPAVWLIRVLLAEHVLPNMFVATANRWSLELKAWELNVTPKGKTKTKGLITFTKANAPDETTVKAGSVVQTLPIDGVVFKVMVTEDTVIPAGVLTQKVPVQAEQAGAAFNLPAGYFNVLPEELPGIAAAVNEPEWITELGANEETDEELALRLQNQFTSSGNWHIDDAYRAVISSVAGIRSDNIFFENTGHVEPGTATAFILMEVGLTPAKVIDQLNHHIMTLGHHGHGDVLTCKPIIDQPVNLECEVVLASNLTTEETEAAINEVEARIRAAFRETEAYPVMTRAKPQSRFSLSQMGTEIHNNMRDVESVRFVVDGNIQKDIVSALQQPRLQSLSMLEVAS